MWKLSVLKNLLHAHTALFLVSVILLSGCAQLAGNRAAEEPFNPEDYAARRLSDADMVKLRELMASPDVKVSASAALLLGKDYLHYGDKNFGKLLIEKNYENPNLDTQMKIFAMLWRMEALLNDNDRAGAEKLKENVLALNKDGVYSRTMQIYCGSTGEDFSACVNEKFKTPVVPAYVPKIRTLPVKPKMIAPLEPTPPPAADNNTGAPIDEYIKAVEKNTPETQAGILKEEPKEQTLKENTQINIIGGDVMSEMVQGMIFAINELKTSFTINTVSDEAAAMGDDAVIVNVNKAEVKAFGQTVSFGADWESLILTAAALKNNENIRNVAICTSTSKIRQAKYMAEQYDASKIKAEVFNYDNPAFQAQLRSFIEAASGRSVLMAGIGSEEEIVNFISVAKFLQNAKNQKIMLIVSSLSDKNFKDEYAQYFKEVFVLTPIELVNSQGFTDANLGYEAFFGNPMSLSNVLGYDVVVYLNALSKTDYKGAFLSSIKSFEDGAAQREIGFYKISRKLEVREVKYETTTTNLNADSGGVGRE